MNPDIQKRAEELAKLLLLRWGDAGDFHLANLMMPTIAAALAAAEAAGREKAFKSSIWACQNAERAYAGQPLHDACIDAIRRVAEKAGA